VLSPTGARAVAQGIALGYTSPRPWSTNPNGVPEPFQGSPDAYDAPGIPGRCPGLSIQPLRGRPAPPNAPGIPARCPGIRVPGLWSTNPNGVPGPFQGSPDAYDAPGIPGRCPGLSIQPLRGRPAPNASGDLFYRARLFHNQAIVAAQGCQGLLVSPCTVHAAAGRLPLAHRKAPDRSCESVSQPLVGMVRAPPCLPRVKREVGCLSHPFA